MIQLKITYRVRAHQMEPFERIFKAEILPLVKDHGIRIRGFWRTLVGKAGEYLELWDFESLADFDLKWHALMKDPRLAAIFERTGPMVENEEFVLIESVLGPTRSEGSDSLRV